MTINLQRVSTERSRDVVSQCSGSLSDSPAGPLDETHTKSSGLSSTDTLSVLSRKMMVSFKGRAERLLRGAVALSQIKRFQGLV